MFFQLRHLRVMLRALVFSVLSAGMALATTPEKMSKEKHSGPDGELLYREVSVGSSALKPALLVFLHGMGERGSDNEVQLKHGVSDMLKFLQKGNRHAVVIAPQCPDGERWGGFEGNHRQDIRLALTDKPVKPMASLLALIDKKIASGEVDPKRIYLTGLSMGGFGTFAAVARRPELFAAAAPVCGGGDPKTASKMKDVPFWVFHGDQDKAVPVECSQVMVGALIGSGGEVKYTEYSGVGHDSWTPAYRTEKLIDWFFAQQKD